MFYFLSKTLDFFIMPIGVVFMLLTYAFFTTNCTKARWCVGLVAVLLYVLCNPYLVNRAFRWWEYPPRNIADVDTGQAVGIVLTGGMIRMPSLRSDHPGLGNHADRFLQAYLLYKAGKISKILISGATHSSAMKSGQDDGRQAAELLLQWGVPAGDVILENTSRNTYQNAVNTVRILRERFSGQRYLLITSAFHLRRAVGCFSKAGVRVDTFPADFYGVDLVLTYRAFFRPDPEIFGYAHFLWREWIGYFAYKVVGYI